MKRSTPLRQGRPLQRKTPLLNRPAKPRPRAISPASTAQRRKVAAQVCAVCQHDACDPAHLTPRSNSIGTAGCNSADCVIALCRQHHRLFDDGNLDMLPHLSGQGFGVELAHMQGHYDDPVSVLTRLSGRRWAPADERCAA